MATAAGIPVEVQFEQLRVGLREHEDDQAETITGLLQEGRTNIAERREYCRGAKQFVRDVMATNLRIDKLEDEVGCKLGAEDTEVEMTVMRDDTARVKKLHLDSVDAIESLQTHFDGEITEAATLVDKREKRVPDMVETIADKRAVRDNDIEKLSDHITLYSTQQ